MSVNEDCFKTPVITAFVGHNVDAGGVFPVSDEIVNENELKLEKFITFVLKDELLKAKTELKVLKPRN